MPLSSTEIRKIRYFVNLTAIYLLTIAVALFIIQPQIPFDSRPAITLTKAMQTPQVPNVPKFHVIDGLPVQIVIPSDSINLPVDKGYYDSADNSWTLSGYRTQFAMISTLPNNYGGETFIYGHNNDYVFGALRHHTPAVGTIAMLYTNNGYIFEYSFESVKSVGPSGTSILDYSGRPPILMIQTCTGSLNEWRTEYKFVFVKVIQ
jgi:sortase (surface protein transpeptidase)